MNNIDKKNWFLYVIAMLIPLLFFTHLEWRPENPAWHQRDIFFGADSDRVINDLKDGRKQIQVVPNEEKLIAHTRDNLHPYFSLVAVTISNAGSMFGFGNVEFPIYRTVLGCLSVFLFWLFIFKQTNAIQAFSSLALLMSSMAFRVWTAVPDTFIFSFAGLMVSLNLIRINAKPEYVLLSSMFGALSNITLGAFNLIFNSYTLKQAVKIAATFLLMALILSIIQQIIYPNSSHFFEYGIIYESDHINSYHSIKFIFFKVFDFFVSGFMLPISSNISLPVSSDGLWLEFFKTNHSKRFMLQTISMILLLSVLYASSLIAFSKKIKSDKIRSTILGYICFELVFHLIYGDPPFLYALNFLPMIIIFLSIYQLDKIKQFQPFLFLLMAILIQKFSVLEIGLFNRYFL